mmetsp:Transcript_61416/g.168649  ORF Transcript_61416/g.168649 Transcript_61416/m.168649 type:complete len:193 (+) Transcript_61416:385-963(+)
MCAISFRYTSVPLVGPLPRHTGASSSASPHILYRVRPTPLQSLLNHVSKCSVMSDGGCLTCRRTWTMLKLHAFSCHRESCPVPWCRHINLRRDSRHEQQEWVESLKALKDSESEMETEPGAEEEAETKAEMAAEGEEAVAPQRKRHRSEAPFIPEINPEVIAPSTSCRARGGSGGRIRVGWCLAARVENRWV